MFDVKVIQDVLLSVLLGVFGGALLKTFYSMVRAKAPTSYAYSASHLERSAKSSIVAYAIFRFAPVYFVSLAVCGRCQWVVAMSSLNASVGVR